MSVRQLISVAMVACLSLTTACSFDKLEVNSASQKKEKLPKGIVTIEDILENQEEQAFRDLVHKYQHPQLFLDNKEAFRARLHLLDQAPPGSKVKIMTFVFDFGKVALTLASHMCSAAQRGVKVEFTPDNMSGSDPNRKDVFDKPNTEEIYQFLANCGVEVKIHNHIFEDQYEVKTLSASSLYHKFQTGEGAYFAGIREYFRDRRQALANWFVNTWLVKKARERNFLWSAKLLDIYDSWYKPHTVVVPNELMEFLTKIGSKNSIAEVLVTLREAKEDRSIYHFGFNRLNHRKLFWVQSPAGDTCLFLGGRNIGEHYLDWEYRAGNFVDGDVMICDHHLNKEKGDGDIIAQTEKSFDEVFNATNSGLSPEDLHPLNFKIRPNPNYQYKYIDIQKERKLKRFGTVYTFPDNVLSQFQRASVPAVDQKEIMTGVLPVPVPVEDAKSIVHGQDLKNASRWRFKKASWKWEEDEVREELIQIINRETVELNIESAYVTFDEELQIAIEKALRRGVKVNVVSNSLFTNDGASGAIRFLNGRWIRKMQERYRLFNFYATALEGGGHMIHFKGVGARCQYVESSGKYFKTFLIGSHNFHLRSGTSDKEHALIWDEPPGRECLMYNKKAAAALADQAEEIKSHYVDYENNIPKDEWKDMIHHKKDQWQQFNCQLMSSTVDNLDKETGEPVHVGVIPLYGAVHDCLKTDTTTVRARGALLKRYTSFAQEFQDVETFFKGNFEGAAKLKHTQAKLVMDNLMLKITNPTTGQDEYRLKPGAEILMDFTGPIWDLIMPFF